MVMADSSDNDGSESTVVPSTTTTTTLPESTSLLETEPTEIDSGFATSSLAAEGNNNNSTVAYEQENSTDITSNVLNEDVSNSENLIDHNKWQKSAEKPELQIKYSNTRHHFRNFKHSILTPFFGSNEPEPLLDAVKEIHPCQLLSRDVHKCLDQHNNNFSFCQTRVANLYRCLREFKM